MYAIYFTWNDGTEDTFNVPNATIRDLNILDMIRRGDFKEISYCRIYKSGEYGIRHYICLDQSAVRDMHNKCYGREA